MLHFIEMFNKILLYLVYKYTVWAILYYTVFLYWPYVKRDVGAPFCYSYKNKYIFEISKILFKKIILKLAFNYILIIYYRFVICSLCY